MLVRRRSSRSARRPMVLAAALALTAALFVPSSAWGCPNPTDTPISTPRTSQIELPPGVDVTCVVADGHDGPLALHPPLPPTGGVDGWPLLGGWLLMLAGAATLVVSRRRPGARRNR